jgi:hypothetical protein
VTHGLISFLDEVKKSVALKYLVAKEKFRSLVKIISKMTAEFSQLEGLSPGRQSQMLSSFHGLS